MVGDLFPFLLIVLLNNEEVPSVKTDSDVNGRNILYKKIKEMNMRLLSLEWKKRIYFIYFR
jgi:hypothetical protein